MADEVGTAYLAAATTEFQRYKGLADGALRQIREADWFRAGDSESNSIALVVKHIAGNLRSRWTDFLTTDGEKPDRHRDTEFELADDDSVPALSDAWERSWATVFAELGKLTPMDLLRTVTIRSEPHSVLQAVERSLSHTAYHVGQIVYLAKDTRGAEWQSLSIPRGQSEAFTRRLEEQAQER